MGLDSRDIDKTMTKSELAQNDPSLNNDLYKLLPPKHHREEEEVKEIDHAI